MNGWEGGRGRCEGQAAGTAHCWRGRAGALAIEEEMAGGSLAGSKLAGVSSGSGCIATRA